MVADLAPKVVGLHPDRRPARTERRSAQRRVERDIRVAGAGEPVACVLAPAPVGERAGAAAGTGAFEPVETTPGREDGRRVDLQRLDSGCTLGVGVGLEP